MGRDLNNPERCRYCAGKLDLVAADEPWHDAYLICEDCDSTYPYFEEKEDAEVSE